MAHRDRRRALGEADVTGLQPRDDGAVEYGDLQVRRAGLSSPGEYRAQLVARREELKRLNVTLGLEPANRWTLTVKPNATPAQQAHLAAWLR